MNFKIKGDFKLDKFYWELCGLDGNVVAKSAPEFDTYYQARIAIFAFKRAVGHAEVSKVNEVVVG